MTILPATALRYDSLKIWYCEVLNQKFDANLTRTKLEVQTPEFIFNKIIASLSIEPIQQISMREPKLAN